MFGRSLFGDNPMGYFMEDMFRQIDENKRKRANEEAGIITDEETGLTGVPSKKIPTKYSKVNFANEHYICKLNDVKTLYKKDGSFLFSATHYENLEKGMYLVKLVGDEQFCLYKGFEKLSEPIFKTRHYPDFKFEADYCALKFEENKNDRGECVVNMDGEVVLEFGYDFSSHISITNNIACYKEYYYNLHTGEKICYRKSYGDTLEADNNMLFVQAACKGYNSTDTKGVYLIDTMTGEFQIFGTPPVEKNPTPPSPSPEEVKQREIEDKKPKVVKQERNDICQCGSGKKFKNCCIDKVGQILEQKALPE